MIDIKIKMIIYAIVLFLLGLFFVLWLNTSKNLKTTTSELCLAQDKIKVLAEENTRLVEYNLKKDAKLKDIEAEYKEKLKNIPVDACGDAKPSKALLNYLRGNK